jgi:hypothetical protein
VQITFSGELLVKNGSDGPPRRQFLLDLAGFSASIIVSQLVACTQEPRSEPKSTPEKPSRVAPAQPFRVAVQGSFAIFVNAQNVVAYAPDVGTHRYCISDGDYKTCEFGKFGKDLMSIYGSSDLSLSGVTPANTAPVFGTTSGPNVINTDINPVLGVNDVKRPASREYLYAITLPLPTSVTSWCLVGKDQGEFFINPPLALKDLARVHVFEYAEYDLANLAINGKQIQLPPGDTHIKILSEPFNQITAVNECKKHVQRANKAIGDMIQVKSGIAINEGYCYSMPPGMPMGRRPDKDGGGGSVTPFSRPPACITMLVNDTGTGMATGSRQP